MIHTNFILSNLEEDDEKIHIYLNEKINNTDTINFIEGLYIEGIEGITFISKFKVIEEKILFSVNKEYLKKSLEYNHKSIMSFKIGINLVDSISYYDIVNDGNDVVWKWEEHNFALMYNSKGFFLANEIDSIFESNDIYGKMTKVNEFENNIIIKKIYNNKFYSEILKFRIFDKFNERKYLLRLVSRKTQTVISEIKEYIEDKNEIIFKITADDTNVLNNFDYIYNIFLVVFEDGKEFSTRLKSNNYDITPNLICHKNSSFLLRAYTTEDDYLSLIIKEYTPKIEIENIYFNENNIKIEGNVYLFLNKINCSIENIYLKDSYNENIKNCIKFDISNHNDINNFTINIDSYNLCKNNVVGRYYIVLSIKIYEQIYEYKLQFNSDSFNKDISIFYPKLNYKIDNVNIILESQYIENNFVMDINNDIKFEISSIRTNDNMLEIMCKHNLKDVNIKPTLILATKEKEYKSKFIEMSSDYFTFKIDSNTIYGLDYYKIHKFIINIDGEGYSFKKQVIVSDTEKFRIKRKKVYFNIKSLKKHNNILIIEKEGENIQLRKMNIFNFRKIILLKHKFASMLVRFTKKFLKNPVWIIGENLAQVAQDNGFAFFEYCMKNDIKEQVYYVTKRENQNYENLKPYKNKLLIYDSFKHFYYYELSKYLIVSHGIRDTIPTILHDDIRNNPKKIIYLQHGIIAMKKVFFNKSSYNSNIEKFIVSSEREKKIMTNQMGFDDKQIAITGLSRFDKLVDESKMTNTRTILIMPTWRDWLQNNRGDFIKSKFYIGYKKLLNDEKLHRLLDNNDLIIKFYPHIEIQKRYSDLFMDIHPKIKAVNLGEENVQDLIKQASLMITDYSSVALDFNYLKKPVIFYQSDYEEYASFRGSFIDLRRQLPGDRCVYEKEVIEIIEQYVKSDFNYDNRYLDRSKEFYKYNDNKNSERIYNLIK